MWTTLEGIMVTSRYELQSHLATGGMAAVFRAWDHRLRRPVALKMLRALADAEPRAVERFRREAKATASLRDPHIVEVYDFFAERGCYYLVMELVEGRNLKDCLAAYGRLPIATALAIAAQVCEALDAAHARGFVHRDIKPQNILLDDTGTAKLADFGIVQVPFAQPFTTDGIVLGTADYISPEQAQGQALGPTTDIYSLGAVLYEMLSGVLPYNGTTPVAVAMCHASAPLPSLRRANPAIPPTVERIVLRAMQKGPAVRYPSARAMRAALLAALGELQLAEASERTTETPCEEVTVPVAATDQWRTLADALVRPAEPAEPAQPPGAAEELAPDERLPDLEEQAFVSVGAAAAFHASGDISEDALFRLCTVLLVGMLLLLGIVILHGVV